MSHPFDVGTKQLMEERLQREVPQHLASEMWTTTGVLMGLRYPLEQIAHLLQGVHGMKDSTFYQMIVEEGEAKKGRKMLLRQGRKKFGPPSPEAAEKLNGIDDLDLLDRLADRLLDVSSWDELLATP